MVVLPSTPHLLLIFQDKADGHPILRKEGEQMAACSYFRLHLVRPGLLCSNLQFFEMIWLTFQVPRSNPTCRVFLCGLPCLVSVLPPDARMDSRVYIRAEGCLSCSRLQAVAMLDVVPCPSV